MRKILYSLALLLAAAVLCAGAFLPKIAAVIQDKTVIGKVAYESIQSVQLQIDQEQIALSLMERLALAQINKTVPVSDADARMTEETLNQTVQTSLKPYIEKGMIPSWDFTFEWKPVLAYDPDDPRRYCIFGEGFATNNEEPFLFLDLRIDDETGRVLVLHFNTDEQLFESHQLQNRLDFFCKTYFQELGLDEQQKAAEKNNKGDTAVARYTLDNLNVVFYVHEYGFYLFYEK